VYCFENVANMSELKIEIRYAESLEIDAARRKEKPKPLLKFFLNGNV